MGQLEGDDTGRAVELAGQGDARKGILGVDELHGAVGVVAAAGHEGRQRTILGVLLPVIPLPGGRQHEPIGGHSARLTHAVFVDTEATVGGQVHAYVVRTRLRPLPVGTNRDNVRRVAEAPLEAARLAAHFGFDKCTVAGHVEPCCGG